MLETGIFLPAGEGKIGFILHSEIAANILISKGHDNKDYDISAIESVSFGEIARLLSEISGKAVPYYSPELQVYIDTLTGNGVPLGYAGMFGGFAQAADQGELFSDQFDTVELLGREPLSVKEYLRNFYALQV